MDADVPAAVAPGPATADSSQQADSLFIHRYDDDFMMYVFKVRSLQRAQHTQPIGHPDTPVGQLDYVLPQSTCLWMITG
jgi:hypothetical protein